MRQARSCHRTTAATARQLFAWMRRQMLITRRYAPAAVVGWR